MNKIRTKTQQSNHVTTTLKVYRLFKNEIDQLRMFSVKRGELEFEHLVRSAYTKCYDFIVYCCSTKEIESAFFRLPGLRSICEDLITINYLTNLDVKERDEIIILLSSQELFESIIVQENFFQKYNPAQILVPSDLIPAVEREKINNKHKKTKEPNSQYISLPSVFKMAKDYGFEDLYKYLYHASSKAVHFSVDTLLKMGWGNIDKDTDVIEGKSSYKNYHLYYHDFSIFYASYIFLKQTHVFKSIIPISTELIDGVNVLMKKNENIDWPELTTFDQLNIKEPSRIIRLLARSAYNVSGKSST